MYRVGHFRKEHNMKDTNICIIGGGSRLWAIQFMKDLSYNKMTHGSLVLYDIDNESSIKNVEVANRIFKINESEGHFKVKAVSSLDEALKGMDLVIISIEPGLTECRYGDLVLPEEYGILQSVGDTTGPGGIMRARRALPLFFDFAKAIERNCPQAWVINYTNPMTLCTAALYKAYPKIKVLGCCHEVFHTEAFIAKLVAKWFEVPLPDRREIQLDITGVNHFTFVTKASWNGIDLFPRLVELANSKEMQTDLTEVAKTRIKEEKWFDCDQRIALALLREFGALGAAGDRHLAEFIPWFIKTEEELFSYGVVRTPYSWRARQAIEKKAKVFKDDELIASLSDEEGVDILRSLMGDRTILTNINYPNNGQISYLPKGRIVESMGYISNNSIRPLVSTDPPLAVQNLIRRVSDTQEMVLEAMWQNDEELLFRAFLLDPLIDLPLKKARALFEKMLEASAIRY